MPDTLNAGGLDADSQLCQPAAVWSGQLLTSDWGSVSPFCETGLLLPAVSEEQTELMRLL